MKKKSNCQNRVSQVEELLKIKCSRKGISYVIDKRRFSEEQKYDKLFFVLEYFLAPCISFYWSVCD